MIFFQGSQERQNSLYTTHNDTHDVLVFKDKKGVSVFSMFLYQCPLECAYHI